MRAQRSKTPLALMEQVVMVLVFAIAATLCVQAFTVARNFSIESNDEDKAMMICQTIAETAKACSGDMERIAEKLDGDVTENEMILYYNEDWELCQSQQAVFMARFWKDDATELLGTGTVKVEKIKENKEIFTINTAWQEDKENE